MDSRTKDSVLLVSAAYHGAILFFVLHYLLHVEEYERRGPNYVERKRKLQAIDLD